MGQWQVLEISVRVAGRFDACRAKLLGDEPRRPRFAGGGDATTLHGIVREGGQQHPRAIDGRHGGTGSWYGGRWRAGTGARHHEPDNRQNGTT
jgi:hypothetical protein